MRLVPPRLPLPRLALALAVSGCSTDAGLDTGDDDGDGIPNHADLCPDREGGRFDEDLDGIGDECDACPIAPPPATPDPDGDEVDSPCDPDPTVPGDRIVVFSGFNDPALPAGWAPRTPAAWEIRGGTLVVTAGADEVETLTAPLPLSSNHMAVLTSYRIDATDAMAIENAASVIAVDRRPGGLSIISCGASRTGSTDRLLLDTDLANEADPFDALFDPASLYQLAARVTNAQAACALVADAETGAVQARTGGQAMTEAGLSARGATVRFSYLLAVQRGTSGAPQ